MSRSIGWFVYAALALFFFVGFLTWHSTDPVFLRWSLRYTAILVVIGGVLALPPLIGWAVYRFGARQMVFALTPSLALVAVVYLVASTHYYWTRSYGFDPFLQVPPPELESEQSARGSPEFRILALGGSTTRNAELPSVARYPAVLERLLRERRPDLNVVVLNAGMEWYTTKHSLIDYVSRLRDWHPDMVVVMHGVNDLYRSCTPPQFVVPPNTAYRPDWSHFYGAAINAANPPSFPSFLYEKFVREISLHWYADWRFVERDYPTDRWLALPEYRKNLHRLAHYVSADRRSLVFVTQASLLRGDLSFRERRALSFGFGFCQTPLRFARSEFPSPRSLGQGLAAFNAATVQAGRELGIPVVDADAALPKNLATFRDDVHYTPAGSEALARVIADTVAAQLPPIAAY